MPKNKVGDVLLDLKFDDIAKAIGEQLDNAVFAGGNIIIDDAERRAPRLTGDLAESGYVSTQHKTSYRHEKTHSKERKPKENGTAAVGFADFKAHWNEFGTKSKPTGTPFLRPAMDSNKDKVRAAIVAEIKKALK